jgi:hypothetical protein
MAVWGIAASGGEFLLFRRIVLHRDTIPERDAVQ